LRGVPFRKWEVVEGSIGGLEEGRREELRDVAGFSIVERREVTG